DACAPRLCVLHGVGEFYQRSLGISVEHAAIWFEEERVLDTGEAFPLSSLQHDYPASFVDFEYRHSSDGTFWIVARIGIHYIIGADNDSYVGCRKLGVDLLEII